MSGRIRSIKPEVLEDEVAAGLSDAAWRMWVSLWVLADDHGNVRMGDRFLASNVWQDTTRDVDAPRAELDTKGMVVLYAVEGQRYGHIAGFTKHQRVDNAGKARVPGPHLDDGSWTCEPSIKSASAKAAVRARGNLSEFAEKSANNFEHSEGRRSRVAGARIPAARPPTSDLRPPTSDPERERAHSSGSLPIGTYDPESDPEIHESRVTCGPFLAAAPASSADVADSAAISPSDGRMPQAESSGPLSGSQPASRPVRHARRLEGSPIPYLMPDDLEPTEETVQQCLMAGYPDPRPLMPNFRAHHRAKGSQSASWQDSIFVWAGRQKQFEAPRGTGTHGAPNPGPVNPSRRPPPKE